VELMKARFIAHERSHLFVPPLPECCQWPRLPLACSCVEAALLLLAALLHASSIHARALSPWKRAPCPSPRNTISKGRHQQWKH